MNYEESLEYIHNIPAFSPKAFVDGTEEYNLNAISELCHRLGDPQDRLKYVHVAGTNGKGSTVACISSILKSAGMKVGIYTSPFLERFTERIRVNDEEISEEDLARIVTKIVPVVESMKADGCQAPSEFEIVCAVAFLYFAEKNCEIVVLEVGLGGRLDATNVIKCPELAVITTISLDHCEILGDTLPKIAAEKAGIIKEGGTVLLYPQNPEVEKVFARVCQEKNALLIRALMPACCDAYDLNGQDFTIEGELPIQDASYPTEMTTSVLLAHLHTPLLGTYQIRNAAVAANAALILRSKGFPILMKNIYDGLAATEWAGRFELLRKEPYLLIDGSHNEEGASVLQESLMRYFPNKKITFVCGVLADKAYDRMLAYVLPLAKEFYCITPPNPRALAATDLAAYLTSQGAKATAFDSVEAAVDAALAANSSDGSKSAVGSEIDSDSNDGVVCVFGSLYYIGQVRKYKNVKEV